MSAARVTLERGTDGVAHLRLARPEARNAIDPAWVADFASAVGECAGARAVLISAEGTAFTVGGDLEHLAAHRGALREALAAVVPRYHEALLRLAGLDAPVVAAVTGAVAGGGLGLVWCSDIVVAGENVRFATAFHRLGLSGDGGSGWWLPRLIGTRRAQRMLIAGYVPDAAEALEWGLVSELVPSDRVLARAGEIATQLAAGPTFAYAKMRKLLLEGHAQTLGEYLTDETAAMLASADAADAAEGVSAFMEHRAPIFSGQATPEKPR